MNKRRNMFVFKDAQIFSIFYLFFQASFIKGPQQCCIKSLLNGLLMLTHMCYKP
jgi:hypothetical protein